MNDEAKLGLVAGVLAVVGVAVFGMPREPSSVVAPPAATAGTATQPPNLPPAAVAVPGR